MKLKIYTEEVLRQTVALATESQSQAVWIEKARSNIAALLIKRPQEYRSFGAFWWAIKKQLVEAGNLAGDVSFNLQKFEEVTTGDAALDLAGALLFHDHTAGTLNTGSVFPLDSDEGQVDYVLDDQEMEARIFTG